MKKIQEFVENWTRIYKIFNHRFEQSNLNCPYQCILTKDIEFAAHALPSWYNSQSHWAIPVWPYMVSYERTYMLYKKQKFFGLDSELYRRSIEPNFFLDHSSFGIKHRDWTLPYLIIFEKTPRKLLDSTSIMRTILCSEAMTFSEMILIFLLFERELIFDSIACLASSLEYKGTHVVGLPFAKIDRKRTIIDFEFWFGGNIPNKLFYYKKVFLIYL